MEEAVDTDDMPCDDDLLQFNHQPASSLNAHHSRQYSYTWVVPLGVGRTISGFPEVKLHKLCLTSNSYRHNPYIVTPTCPINSFPLHYHTPTYPPFPPPDDFTPSYPLCPRPKSPLVSTPQIPRSGSSDVIPSLTDTKKMEAKCMKNAGFDTIGELLAAMFSKELWGSESTRHLTVSHSVAAFLRCQSIDPHQFPVVIVDAMYHHPSSQTFVNCIPSPPQFNVPQYACPPSERLLPDDHLLAKNTTRNALLAWSLSRVLHHVDKEVDALLHPSHGLTWLSTADHKLSWCTIIDWSLTQAQETIANQSPMIFAMLTTISVGRRAWKQLRGATNSILMDTESMSEDQTSRRFEESSDEEDTAPPVEPGQTKDTLSAGVPKGMFYRVLRYHCLCFFTSVLGRVGLSVAYSSVLSTLHTLAADSDILLRVWGATTEIGEPRFLFLFDNVNKMQHAWQSIIGWEDEVKSGTAATLIKLKDVPPGAMLAEPLLKNLKEKVCSKLTVEMLVDDIDWAHIESIGATTVLRVWTKHVSGLAKFHSVVESCFSTTYAKHPLQLWKSEIHPMCTTDINEATTTGVASVLYNLISQLGIVGSWLNKYVVLVCGDQLSVDWILKVKLYMGTAATTYNRHDWALPVIQLWHMKWALQKCIFRLHWWDNAGKEIFGLHHDCDLLGRGKFNPVKCDFYPAHHILEDRFDALILDALWIMCKERTKIVQPPTNKLLEGLEEYFLEKGPFHTIMLDALLELTEQVYNYYMCNAVHEAALGYGDRDPALYGSLTMSNEMDSVPMPANKESQSSSIPPGQTKKRGKKTTAVRNFSQGDQTLATTINFLCITFWYLKMCAAAAEGDIGHIFEIIKTAILNNYLVNPSGLHGHWLELDLLQEHFNFWIKQLFNSKSHDFDARHLAKVDYLVQKKLVTDTQMLAKGMTLMRLGYTTVTIRFSHSSPSVTKFTLSKMNLLQDMTFFLGGSSVHF
ncbi:hypothetical protein L208DRAFT_1459229 [Tricholoma matsutake]|nr:hypothetical protein L208DRAFT_1459229 [Tricholoma matsutake 945]